VANALTARMHKGINTHLNEGQTLVVELPDRVRYLTPREAERGQGLPDDWTAIAWRGKAPAECPDTPRYKAVGNSIPVPMLRWIGERIAAAHAASSEAAA
jgi:site-specific DNA-cytosine methylase